VESSDEDGEASAPAGPAHGAPLHAANMVPVGAWHAAVGMAVADGDHDEAAGPTVNGPHGFEIPLFPLVEVHGTHPTGNQFLVNDAGAEAAAAATAAHAALAGFPAFGMHRAGFPAHQPSQPPPPPPHWPPPLRLNLDASSDVVSGTGGSRRLATRAARRRREAAIEKEPPPHACMCPISREVMELPTITPMGTTYDWESIVQWVHMHGTYPMGESRYPLRVSELIPNLAVRNIIEDWSENRHHPNGSTSSRNEPESAQHEQLCRTTDASILRTLRARRSPARSRPSAR